jgi:hypothetical protein
MENKELKKEKEKERAEEEEVEVEVEVEVEQRKEEGELPFRVSKPPFSNQQGLFVLDSCQQIMIHRTLSVFVVVSKFHEMNI